MNLDRGCPLVKHHFGNRLGRVRFGLVEVDSDARLNLHEEVLGVVVEQRGSIS